MDIRPVLEMEMTEYDNPERLPGTSRRQDFVGAHDGNWNTEKLDGLSNHLRHD